MGEKSSQRYQKVVATGCLIRHGKVLLIRRAKAEKFLPGYYEMPGGKFEFGEQPEEALRREFTEEVGFPVNMIRPYWSFAYITDEGQRHTIEIDFLVTVDDSLMSVRLGTDHDHFIWVTKEELNQYHITDEMKVSISKGFVEYGRD